ncbi:MAG: dihydrofolate reductase family protein [Thermoplasmata archaeon]|nr:MAG: dihydrofolate reductase family protein [Thermoplasmata archaeon]
MDPRCEGSGRPWIILNFAMSADGKLALADGTPVGISSEEDMVRVHRMRAECDAILVGVGTVAADDPKLHVSPRRVADPPPLTKIVLDASGRTPAAARFLRTPGQSVVATIEPTAPRLEEALGDRAKVIACGEGPLVDLEVLMGHLGVMGVSKLMVEGGGETLWSFLSAGLVDEYSVYIGPMIIGGGSAPTPADGPGALVTSEIVRLEMTSMERLGEGLWIQYKVVPPD